MTMHRPTPVRRRPLRALAAAARFAGHFAVACVTVAVLGGDTEH